MPAEDSTHPALPAAGPTETLLWEGRTSQWVHFWAYFFCALVALGALAAIPLTAGLSALGLVIPALLAPLRWWTNRATSYELTSQRLRIRRGVLNRRLDELELYRVKDYVMDQPLLLRVLGLGNLTLLSSDASTPTVAIPAIAEVESVREKLRSAVQSERDRKRVRALDVDETGALD